MKRLRKFHDVEVGDTGSPFANGESMAPAFVFDGRPAAELGNLLAFSFCWTLWDGDGERERDLYIYISYIYIPIYLSIYVYIIYT